MASKSKATVSFSGVLELDSEDWEGLKSILDGVCNKNVYEFQREAAYKLRELMIGAEERESE
jgi:hypothetical protein